MKKAKGRIIKILVGIILVIGAGIFPYFISCKAMENYDSEFTMGLVKKLAINQYINDTIKEYKEMAETDEIAKYVSTKEFKKELIEKTEDSINMGDYSVASGIMNAMQKVFIKLGMICSAITLIIYIFILKKNRVKSKV
ncbi:hypothetical protein [Romboutsia lituseburensis]|uniref:hypothetical protein n=1 Tax=Romboutsia lituseburensis TaxID=1537 RepID=UPI00215B43EB|nr:hypothetical protein [Romboutsia lituseburensis]MCR8747268.1 hypothetical protein [Romboutsia lituseburensis]